MGRRAHRVKRTPAERAKLAKVVLVRKEAGASDRELGYEHGISGSLVRTLCSEAKKAAGKTGRYKPAPDRPARKWLKPVELKRAGTPGGDAMASAQMGENRTLDEPTHELQGLLDGAWEALDVASANNTLKLYEAQLCRRGKHVTLYERCRVIERVPR